jgi:hypothetical protein
VVQVKKKRLISNKAIVVVKLTAACMAFFSYCVFFFGNKDFFLADLRSARVVFPIVFILGIVFLVGYIANMVGRIENKTLWKSDRLYILYQIVFTAMLVGIVCRCFLENLTVPRLAVVILVISGIATLCIPQVKDNDNSEF